MAHQEDTDFSTKGEFSKINSQMGVSRGGVFSGLFIKRIRICGIPFLSWTY